MEAKERIIQEAKNLFLRLGIRSVSMDEIATQMGISKKTLYQHFQDKDQLVDLVLEEQIKQMQAETIQAVHSSSNAIGEIFNTMDMMVKHSSNMNPMVLFDLQKYHFGSFQKFAAHKNDFLFNIISNNLKKGVEEGLYRSDINIEILAKFRLETLMIGFNMDAFPTNKFNVTDVSLVIIENFLYGLATEKGFNMIESYKNKRKENNLIN
ncbi:MAG: TetR/AcrR family transcriptional regulator [Bacteroidota bacterium]|jgi:AcrR family transcriptional regulator|nr:TetR/AcrR family transcriptional regulator [Chitinophagaceae bacterium]MCE2759316.1 TetR/AcrR family transcriptional regulator [Chitinophagaceae bacterium]GDX43234.1 TetR family transcriptional regulator [Bacteroidota bacterium]